MALFVSDKRYVMGRLRRHDWRNDAELQELLEKLQELDLRLGDLLWMVGDSEPVIHTYGSQLLVQGEFPQASATILRAAVEETGHGRTSLLSLLPRLRDHDTVLPRFAEWMSGKDDQRVAVATEAILLFPPRRVANLLGRLMAHEQAEIRWRALNRLIEESGSTGPDSRLRALVLRAARDPDERIRVRSIQTLARHPDVALVEFFVERLRVETVVVQQVLKRALATLIDEEELGVEEHLIPLLSEGDQRVRSAVLELVQGMRHPARAVQKLLRYSKELMGWMRDRIQQAIRSLGPELLDPMIELMGHEDPAIRSSALMFASQFSDPRMVEAVIGTLDGADWWTQVVAIETLGRLGDERAVDPLVGFLADDELRWSAIEALAHIGTVKALRPVGTLLTHHSADVRLEVIRALDVANESRALPALRRLAETDQDAAVRDRAVKAFRAIAARNSPDGVGAETIEDIVGAAPKTLKRIDALLAETRRVGGSDLHLAPGAPPYVRLFGELRRVGNRPYSAEETRSMLLEVLTPEQTLEFKTNHQVDLCYSVADAGRYRANVYEQRRGATGVFRVIPEGIPTFGELRIPNVVSEIAGYNQGLVLVCGTAGSGKTTTLNCLIDLLNQTRPAHIITLEDPIEFTHPFKTSLVNQRQIGRDSESFARALRAALREDPDIIVVGDLRDLESIRLTVTAAETGHLVLATLSTSSAAKSVSRLIDAFPPREQGHVRSMLAESLKLVLGQTLIPKKDKRGRVAAFELLVVTPAVSNLIRERKNHLLPALMQMNRSTGMRTIDQSLKELLDGGLIQPETAYLFAEHKEEFEALVPRSFLEGSYAGED